MRRVLVSVLDRRRAPIAAGLGAMVSDSEEEIASADGAVEEVVTVEIASTHLTRTLRVGDLVEIPTTVPGDDGEPTRIDRRHSVLRVREGGARVRLDVARTGYAT